MGEKLERIRGARSGAMCGGERDEDIVEWSLVILSEKTFRKAEGRSERNRGRKLRVRRTTNKIV